MSKLFDDGQNVITQMALHRSYFMIVVIVMEGIPGIIYTYIDFLNTKEG